MTQVPNLIRSALGFSSHFVANSNQTTYVSYTRSADAAFHFVNTLFYVQTDVLEMCKMINLHINM